MFGLHSQKVRKPKLIYSITMQQPISVTLRLARLFSRHFGEYRFGREDVNRLEWDACGRHL